MKNNLSDLTFEHLPKLWEVEANAFAAKDHPKYRLRYDKTRAWAQLRSL